jgi:hypothetical protein
MTLVHSDLIFVDRICFDSAIKKSNTQNTITLGLFRHIPFVEAHRLATATTQAFAKMLDCLQQTKHYF